MDVEHSEWRYVTTHFRKELLIVITPISNFVYNAFYPQTSNFLCYNNFTTIEAQNHNTKLFF